MRPPPCRSIRLPTAWQHRNIDLTLTSITASHSASVTASKGLPSSTWALFTRMSIRPISAATRSTIASTSAARVTSASTATARLPAASTARADAATSGA